MKKYLKYKHESINPTILDLGANAGLEAIKLFNEFGTTDSKVVLVEPIIENVFGIMKNIFKHKLENNFFVENCAIDLNSGYKQFGYHKSAGMFGRLNGSLDEFNWKEWNYTGNRTVRIKTLEEICPKPNIVKIDIERYEYTILPKLVKNTNIDIIFCELHGPCYPLNIKEFISSCLENTGLVATGYYQCSQNQSGGEDCYTEIAPPEIIQHSDYKYVIMERNHFNRGNLICQKL